jgi:hypothetical protein
VGLVQADMNRLREGAHLACGWLSMSILSTLPVHLCVSSVLFVSKYKRLFENLTKMLKMLNARAVEDGLSILPPKTTPYGKLRTTPTSTGPTRSVGLNPPPTES